MSAYATAATASLTGVLEGVIHNTADVETRAELVKQLIFIHESFPIGSSPQWVGQWKAEYADILEPVKETA